MDASIDDVLTRYELELSCFGTRDEILTGLGIALWHDI